MSAAQTDAGLQERIAAARRDAEQLKEAIRTKRDQLADTSCELAKRIREQKQANPYGSEGYGGRAGTIA
jgi:hypothetical protein